MQMSSFFCFIECGDESYLFGPVVGELVELVGVPVLVLQSRAWQSPCWTWRGSFSAIAATMATCASPCCQVMVGSPAAGMKSAAIRLLHCWSLEVPWARLLWIGSMADEDEQILISFLRIWSRMLPLEANPDELDTCESGMSSVSAVLTVAWKHTGHAGKLI